MPNEDERPPEEEQGNPDLIDQMIPHPGEPPSSGQPIEDMVFHPGEPLPGHPPEFKAEAPEQIGDLATDTVVEDPDSDFDVDAGRVKDVDKAWDMAHAGHRDRSNAADERAFIEKETEVWGKEVDYAQHVRQPKPRRKKAREEFDQKSRELYGDQMDARDAYKVENSERMDDARVNLETIPMRDAKSRAEMYDRQAKRIEAWAGILHDKPVSDEFREKYSEVDITPESLMRLDEELSADKARLRSLENPHDIPHIFLGDKSKEEQRAYNLLEHADEATAQEHDKLREDLQTSIQALNDFYSSLNERTRVQPLRNKTSLLNDFLEDIRSGRASE